MTAGECVDTGAETKEFLSKVPCQSGESVSMKWPADGSKTQQMSQETAGRSDETLQGASLKCLLDQSLFPFKN